MLTGDARRSTQRGRDAVWTRPGSSPRRSVVCVAYFLGAQLGLQLRLPGATPSVLWPPNALLTSALLLVPPRYWGVMLLAAFPAHLTLSAGTDWPATMIGLLFLTNCSEALIGATLLRRFSDAPARFDSLQRLFAFVVSVALFAPVVSSFLDAAVVSSFSAESYWGVWRARTFANVLTAVTVVPAVTSVAGYLISREPWPPLRRMLEWTALGAGLLATWFAIPFAEARYTFIPGAVRVPLAFLLPFIAWAAVRFGTIGASVTVLMTTLLAIVSAAHGNSPFFTSLARRDADRRPVPHPRGGAASPRAGGGDRRTGPCPGGPGGATGLRTPARAAGACLPRRAHGAGRRAPTRRRSGRWASGSTSTPSCCSAAKGRGSS